jgi:hypothetical protein
LKHEVLWKPSRVASNLLAESNRTNLAQLSQVPIQHDPVTPDELNSDRDHNHHGSDRPANTIEEFGVHNRTTAYKMERAAARLADSYSHLPATVSGGLVWPGDLHLR